MCYLSLLVRTHSNERPRAKNSHTLPGGTKWHCGCVEAILCTSSRRLSSLTAIAGIGAPDAGRTHSLGVFFMVVVWQTEWANVTLICLIPNFWHPSCMVSCPAVAQRLLLHILVSSVCNLMAQLHVKHIYTPCLMGTRSGHKSQTTPSQGCPMCGLISCWMSHVCVPRLLLRIHLSYVSTLE